MINEPDEKTVQVGICPFLAFPPVITLPVISIFGHGGGRGCLGDYSQEQSAPVHGSLVASQVWRKLKLDKKKSSVEDAGTTN